MQTMVKNNIYVLFFVALFGFLTVSHSCRLKKDLSLSSFPSLKIGFTTQNFTFSDEISVEYAIMLIDYAAAKGFSWIELRDPNANLAQEECRKIAKYAEQRGIGVAYAIHKGLLDNDFWTIFYKGMENATVFRNNGPNTLRTPACGEEFNEQKDKIGWNEEEFSQLVSNAMKASKIASEKGLQLVVENGLEAIEGDDTLYYGLDDLISVVESLGLQFDTANPFSVSRNNHNPADVAAFLERYSHRLAYIHLKSASNGKALSILADNPLPFQQIFEMMVRVGCDYVAVELAGASSEQEVFDHLDKSVVYLQQRY